MIFVGILSLIVIFGIGWYIGRSYGRLERSFSDADVITIHKDGDLINGDVHTSTIVVDNCKSSVASVTEETRDFAYQQLFSLDISNEMGLDIKNAIYIKLEKTFGFDSGRVETISRNFIFNSPPKEKSIHTITWFEKIQKGYAQYKDHRFPFSFPVDIQAGSTSYQEPCQ